ncbi:hypothetical protein [Methanimicrococcus blatticola]|uniref:hypothetical protein n=1 Tax=Methanimicrococcus blatticola TaxID=91560 RepID=UPI001062355F|nr:hypothetical protein [Methanimicrococcus blatticola]MBZ3935928.1 hypothetical protein [Methanimicrococcus blatticola]
MNRFLFANYLFVVTVCVSACICSFLSHPFASRTWALLPTVCVVLLPAVCVVAVAGHAAAREQHRF